MSLERDGLVALVHQLRSEPIFVRQEDWEKMKAGSTPDPELAIQLASRGLLVQSEEEDVRMLEEVREQKLRELSRPTILYLMLSQGCNFQCKGCPIPGLAQKYGANRLSFEDAVEGIRLWEKHILEFQPDGDPFILIFYGGEPLLNKEVLERALLFAEDEICSGRLPAQTKFMVVTNGSLLDDNIAAFFREHQVIVAVGLDGPADLNDRVRLTPNGQSTFNAAVDSIKRLVEHGVYAAGSATVTPAGVRRMAEVGQLMADLGVSQFGFNLLKGSALNELDSQNLEQYAEGFAEGVLKTLGDAQKSGKFFEYQLEKKATALAYASPFSVDCTCYGNQIVIQADGQVTNCPFHRVDQGHVKTLSETFRISQTPAVRAWRSRLELFRSSFAETDSRDFLTGGGCGWSAVETSTSLSAEDECNNIVTRKVMHELIWSLLPEEQASVVRTGQAAYWGNRRIRAVLSA